MYCIRRLSLILCLLASIVVSIPLRAEHATILQRDELLDEYDFIIVGAGTAGLTVGDRLSENGKFTVLVVEYGYNDTSPSIRSVENTFLVLAGFPPDPDAPPEQFPVATRMYNTTSIVPGLNNRSLAVLAGAVVGGSSAVNGMAFDRGSAEDYDSWVVATGEKHAAEYAKEWGWDNILPMFKKSVTFQAPTPEMVELYNMTSDVAAAYGGHTAIHSCYPPFQFPGLFPMREAISKIPGVEFPIEGADGNATGVFFFPNSIVPNIRKRSYSLSGHYLDKGGPVTRGNFHLISAHRVTQILLTELQSNSGQNPLWQAEEVTITPRDGTLNTIRIKARKEIIVSAGTLHTPQVLQRSGIGPRNVLQAANVPVKVELSGVGENLQDHPWFSVNFTFGTPVLPNRDSLATNATFRAESTELWNANRTGAYSSFVSHGGFLPFSVISNNTKTLVAELLAQDAASFFPPGTDPTVIAGYEVRRNTSAHQLLGTKSAILEALFDGDGFTTPILLKQQSRGTVFLSPDDDGTARGSVEPVVNFGTFSNPIDIKFCIEMLRFWRSFLATPLMQETFHPTEVTPGTDIASDEDITAWLRNNVMSSDGHLIGTAALGPVELGGVLRPDLTVHGTVGLSVADNSIMPLIPGTHTSSTAYAIGEKASLLILARNS